MHAISARTCTAVVICMSKTWLQVGNWRALSLEWGRGRAASTAEACNGDAWGRWLPRIQCREDQRSIKRSGKRRRVQYILYRVVQVNCGRGKFREGRRTKHDLLTTCLQVYADGRKTVRSARLAVADLYYTDSIKEFSACIPAGLRKLLSAR